MARVVRRIAITKARINLGQVARRVHVNREYFILEKDGIPVAGILSADELEDFLEMQEPGLKAQSARALRNTAGERAGRPWNFLRSCGGSLPKPRSELRG